MSSRVKPCHSHSLQVRAFAGWPGTRASFTVSDPTTGQQEAIDIKVLRTRPRAGPPDAVTRGTPAADLAATGMSPPSTTSSPANELSPARTSTATLVEQPQVRDGGREGEEDGGREGGREGKSFFVCLCMRASLEL